MKDEIIRTAKSAALAFVMGAAIAAALVFGWPA